MKKLKKPWFLLTGLTLGLAPIALAASCGSDSSTPPVAEKTVAPDLNLLKQYTLQGNTHDLTFNLAQVETKNKITRLNDQGKQDPSGKEALRIEARVKAFNSAATDKVNTEFMPLEILRLYLLNDLNDKPLTFTNGEVMFTLNGKTSSLKTVYGSTFGFNNTNTNLPDFTGILVNRSNIELRYAALAGYKLDPASGAAVTPQFDPNFKEAVLVSFSEKYFSPNEKKRLLAMVDFAPASAPVQPTTSELVYANEKLDNNLFPDAWKPYIKNVEFETRSIDIATLFASPESAIWSINRPTSLPEDKTKRHILIRLTAINDKSQEIIFETFDIYGLLANNVNIKVDERKVIAPDLNLLKEYALKGNTHAVDFNLAQVETANKITKLNDAGQHDSNGTEVLRVEARVKTFNEGSSDKVNTAFMPLEILKLYLLNNKSLTVVANEVMFTLGGETKSLKTVYGSNFGFTSDNINLPDFTGTLVNRDSFEMRYAPLKGYRLDSASAVAISPKLDVDFKEAVLISLAEKYFTAADQKNLYDALDFAPSTAAVQPTTSALVYATPAIDNNLMPESWKPFVERIEFETTSLGVADFNTTPASAVWSTNRPNTLPDDESKRHILVRLIAKNSASQILVFPIFDLYQLLPNRANVKIDVRSLAAYKAFDISKLTFTWNDSSQKLVFNTSQSGDFSSFGIMRFKLCYYYPSGSGGCSNSGIDTLSYNLAHPRSNLTRADFAKGASIEVQIMADIEQFPNFYFPDSANKASNLPLRNITGYLPAAK